MYNLLFLLIVACLAGCTDDFNEHIVAANSVTMKTVMKQDAAPIQKQGTYDGCMTGIWLRGNSFTRSYGRFRFDPKLVTNDVYMFAWSNAYRMCFISSIFDYNFQFGSKISPDRPFQQQFSPQGSGGGMIENANNMPGNNILDLDSTDTFLQTGNSSGDYGWFGRGMW
jgi:hypothetical protein